ncbi:hypothetical protein Y032_0045g1162 [Ancylostoma ceylanicum]|uniref:SCP domain-containing protein n=1 Tax=Ancylostoma ceylanicum TaxID=53326 RepID=A0A016UDC9_9BILA|nr:hypothetical protein Y032_0045g1162 [Ancylostoma ceylanicum]
MCNKPGIGDNAEHCAFNCSDTLPVEMRKRIVQYQNERRNELLKGQVNGANGNLKPAKYMNDLTWSCHLEAVAASRCRNGFINTNFLYETGAASDIVVGRGCNPTPLHFNDFKKAMDNWRNQAGGYRDNYFRDRTREEFAQMMNADASEVGCAYEKKGRLTSILCLYNKRVVLGEPFYQVAEDELATKAPKNEVKAN